jgi:hypothetical protein
MMVADDRISSLILRKLDITPEKNQLAGILPLNSEEDSTSYQQAQPCPTAAPTRIDLYLKFSDNYNWSIRS